MEVPVIKPTIGDEEIRAVAAIWRSEWVAQELEATAFERIRSFCGDKS